MSMRIFWYAGWLLLTGIVLAACQSGALDVGQAVINPYELSVQPIDSVTIQTSTVMRTDSFITTGDADLLVGNWTDAQMGQLTGLTYTSVDYPPNTLSTQTNLRLDSLVLEMGYSFAYGDTTSAFSLRVYRLAKPLILDPAYVYYNTSSAPYETKPLLQQTFVPRPQSGTRLVRMRVPDALAQSLFAKIQSGDISDATSLADFFPGLALVGRSSANTFVGFSAASTTTGLRLYYHTTDISQTASTLLFPITAKHFTQLQNDRSGTVLSALRQRSDAVSSRLTKNTTFVSLGAGLQTRIEFPYLNQFTQPEQLAGINRALLVVSPVRRDLRDNNPPPAQLALFQTNNQNDVLVSNAIPGGTAGTTPAAASYAIDPSQLLLTDSYTFDLTFYIGEIIRRRTSAQPLMLTFPTLSGGSQYSLRSLIRRVTLGNQQNAADRLQLRLFITSGA